MKHSAVLSARSSLPVFPDKQTLEAFVGMSQRCQRTNPLRRSALRVETVAPIE